MALPVTELNWSATDYSKYMPQGSLRPHISKLFTAPRVRITMPMLRYLGLMGDEPTIIWEAPAEEPD